MPAEGDTSFGCLALGPSIVGGEASRDRASSGMSLFSRLRLSCNFFPLVLFHLSPLDQFLPPTIIDFPTACPSAPATTACWEEKQWFILTEGEQGRPSSLIEHARKDREREKKEKGAFIFWSWPDLVRSYPATLSTCEIRSKTPSIATRANPRYDPPACHRRFRSVVLWRKIS